MKERIAYATLVGLVAYAAVATDLYLPALPAIVDEFNVSEAQGQLTLSLFMLGMAVGQLFFGPLSDFYGRLPVVTVGTVFFIATSVACAAAPSMEFMWVTRFIQGLAASSGPVIARAIVSDRYHGPRAAQVMSMLGAAMAVIPLIAPTIGSWILVVFDWRATYLALAVFAIAVLTGVASISRVGSRYWPRRRRYWTYISAILPLFVNHALYWLSGLWDRDVLGHTGLPVDRRLFHARCIRTPLAVLWLRVCYFCCRFHGRRAALFTFGHALGHKSNHDYRGGVNVASGHCSVVGGPRRVR